MCKGCKEEMLIAYEYQEQGYEVGIEECEGHKFAFVLNSKGEVGLL